MPAELLTAEQIADIKAGDFGGWTSAVTIRHLVATVEHLTEQRDAARAVIRRFLDDYRPAYEDLWVPRWDGEIEHLTPAEAEAIRQARATRPQEPA